MCGTPTQRSTDSAAAYSPSPRRAQRGNSGAQDVGAVESSTAKRQVPVAPSTA